MKFSILCSLLIDVILVNTAYAADDVDPVIFEYIQATPTIQKPFQNITFITILSTNTAISKVELTIISKKTMAYTSVLQEDSNNVFITTETLANYGSYSFYFTVFTKEGSQYVSPQNTFVIVPSLSDRDRDGIPNWWEEKFGFSSSNKEDAFYDTDGDGFTNFEEYIYGMNPLDDNVFEIGWFRIKQNIPYLLLSFVSFLFLLLFSIFGMRRSRTWQ